MTTSKKYIRNEQTISGQIQDEMVMMDLDKGKYFAFNPVATRIWDLLQKPFSIEELCSLLIEEYEVSESQCREEVEELLAELVKLGLVLETE